MTIKSLSSLQIASIMKKGKAYNSGFFLLKTLDIPLKMGDEVTKSVVFGAFISSKKVFVKAVDRNRAKRRLKEAFLKAVAEIEVNNLEVQIPCFVILSKIDAVKVDFKDVVNDIKQILLKNYIIGQ
jgi:ribonuclease P protein component